MNLEQCSQHHSVDDCLRFRLSGLLTDGLGDFFFNLLRMFSFSAGLALLNSAALRFRAAARSLFCRICKASPLEMMVSWTMFSAPRFAARRCSEEEARLVP